MEIYFGRTLVLKDDGTYEVQLTNGRIIRDRFVYSERLLLYLHPSFHDMQFRPIIDMIADCRDIIDATEDVIHKNDKLKFLDGIENIVKSFIQDQVDPMKEAMKDLARIVNTQVDAGKRFYIPFLMENHFEKNINWNLVNFYQGKTKCWSGVMTNSELINFWTDDDSLDYNGLGDNVPIIKSIIVRFLGEDFKLIIL